MRLTVLLFDPHTHAPYPLRCINLPWWFKQDNLCRAELLDNFLDNFLLKL
jgi:hypothetical protein